ncbi:MAG: glycosyltransferase family 2 protein, partial [Solirubrobacterales bacterium]|nr:glycosyltransferase family 2 protein [Solirubrobacterales bacterium]
MSARLAVAVLSYDGRHLLEVLLPSLAAQTLAGFRIVVVDNGSSDGTSRWLAAEWPQVEVVSLPENVGVAAALNVCIRAATGSELVALLNNDLELDPGCLAELAASLDAHPAAGSAGPKLVSFAHRGTLDGAGDVFDWAGTGWRRGHGDPDDGRYDEPEEVFGACGGAAMYRQSAVDAVGAFDESFFAFVEDTDWALRAQLAGWTCRYVPTAIAYHVGSATIGAGMSDFTRYHLWRNSIWMVAKNYPLGALARHLPRILYVQAAQLYLAARAGKLPLWSRIVRDAARGLPDALRRRRTVQATRRLTVRELERVVRQ